MIMRYLAAIPSRIWHERKDKRPIRDPFRQAATQSGHSARVHPAG
jgi:hypothetical protein